MVVDEGYKDYVVEQLSNLGSITVRRCFAVPTFTLTVKFSDYLRMMSYISRRMTLISRNMKEQE